MLPLSAVVGLHRGMDAGIVGRQPKLEGPPFTHFPENQWVRFTVAVILAHLWCDTCQKPLSNMQEVERLEKFPIS